MRVVTVVCRTVTLSPLRTMTYKRSSPFEVKRGWHHQLSTGWHNLSHAAEGVYSASETRAIKNKKKLQKQDRISIKGIPPVNRTHRHALLLLWPWPDDLDIELDLDIPMYLIHEINVPGQSIRKSESPNSEHRQAICSYDIDLDPMTQIRTWPEDSEDVPVYRK